jgi:hypothetical protein
VGRRAVSELAPDWRTRLELIGGSGTHERELLDLDRRRKPLELALHGWKATGQSRSACAVTSPPPLLLRN